MPTINNATVATGTALSMAGNGGRKLARLSNGWLISAVYAESPISLQIFKSTDNGTTWTYVTKTSTNGCTSPKDIAMVSKGNTVYVTTADVQTGPKRFSCYVLDMTKTFADPLPIPSTFFDTNQLNVSSEGTSLAINDAGTELHAAWSSKNSTYPNSFNIRYAKGTIAADGSVTWGTSQFITTNNNLNIDAKSPSLTTASNNQPLVTFDYFGGGSNFYVYSAKFNGVSWTMGQVNLMGYPQIAPVQLFVPQSINGLTNGRLWVAWHGKDATDSTKFNIRTSYSDDGGVTWATPTKQTTGNTYDQTNASLTADAQGKVLLTWDAQNATTTQTALKVFNGTWGATTTLTGDSYTNVTSLFDNTFKFTMTSPPLIRQSSSGVYFSGNYFAGASVAPASNALGDKTASSVLSYTVTPESGSTITSIVEKVNGTTVNTYSNPASLSRTFTIPQSTWDNLKYWNTHTISVTVTDSNGMANTQTYTFNKVLANDASLLEGTKAAKDGKDRISTKREIIAGQIGVPAGSTFDTIIAQLANNQSLRKVASGTAVSSSTKTFIDADTGSSITKQIITVSGLNFKPSVIVGYASSGGNLGRGHLTVMKDGALKNGYPVVGLYGVNIRLDEKVILEQGTFTVPVYNTDPVFWIAIE